MIVRESLDFERGRDPKRAMGIGAKYKLDIRRKYEEYTNWTEFRLFRNDEEIANGSTLKWCGPKYDEEQNQYKNYREFLAAHSLKPNDVEIERRGTDGFRV